MLLFLLFFVVFAQAFPMNCVFAIIPTFSEPSAAET